VAVVYRVPNKKGDGAGRSRYLLSDMKKVLGIRTNAPLSPLPDKSLASEWNRFLKSWQGSYKTTHLIISFPRLLSGSQIEEILEYLDQKLPEYVGDRFHLIVVHREVFNGKSITPEEILEIREGKREEPGKIDGTAFHIVLSADLQGKLLRLRPSEFKKMKLEISEYLTKKFGNEREKEVLQNFKKGIRTRDPFTQGEIKAPEKLEKVKARKLIKEITQALENGDIDTAIKIQKKNRMKFVPYKKGQLSPWNKQKLKEDTVYLFMPKFDGSGIFSMRLPKKAKLLWSQYQTVFNEVQNELGIIEAEARQDRERTEELRAYKRANRELRERAGRVAEGSKELEREALNLGKRIRRRVQQAQNFDGREPEIVELEQAIRTADFIATKDREAQRRDFERVREQISELYKWTEREFGIAKDELGIFAEQQFCLAGDKAERELGRGGEQSEEWIRKNTKRDRKLKESRDKDMGRGVGRGIDIYNSGASPTIGGEDKEYGEEKHMERRNRKFERGIEFNGTNSIGNRLKSEECKLKDYGYNEGNEKYERKTLVHNSCIGNTGDLQSVRIFVMVGTETFVVADDRKVIERLVDEYNAEGYREIEVNEIPELWEKGSYRGTVYLYINNLERKRKVEEELKKVSRTEKQEAPWLTQKYEIVEVKPVGVKTKKYWRKKNSVIFEEDIRKNPGLYKGDEIEEIRQIAISQLEVLKRKRELELKKRKQELERKRAIQRDNGFDISP